MLMGTIFAHVNHLDYFYFFYHLDYYYTSGFWDTPYRRNYFLLFKL